MSEPRGPRVFEANEAKLVEPDLFDGDDEVLSGEDEAAERGRQAPSSLIGGYSALGLLISAMAGLFLLSISLSVQRFLSIAFERQDWIGWTATSLLIVAGLAATVIIVREGLGLFAVRRVTRLKREAAAAISARDVKGEARAVRSLRALYRGRAELKWGLARFGEHTRDVHDAGALAKLFEQTVLAPLDQQARRAILASAKRVSVVTALSPMVWLAMLFVLAENLRLLRKLAGLYGARPGGLGALKLGRMVIGHIVATGGVAMTDDLLGQFLGQDLLRRLSRRLGEGVFNGALTARIGAAAVEVVRPLPFLDAAPVRARDIVPDLLKRSGAQANASP